MSLMMVMSWWSMHCGWMNGCCMDSCGWWSHSVTFFVSKNLYDDKKNEIREYLVEEDSRPFVGEDNHPFVVEDNLDLKKNGRLVVIYEIIRLRIYLVEEDSPFVVEDSPFVVGDSLE